MHCALQGMYYLETWITQLLQDMDYSIVIL